MSMVAAILFGMVTMTFIYRYFGQGASASDAALQDTQPASVASAPVGKVLGDHTGEANEVTQQVIENSEASSRKEFENKIRTLVKGYPIEKMVPYIAKQDKIVAAFLVGMAKQESLLGKRVPVLNGQDCFNLWGFRQQRVLMGSDGHTCFNSRQDAVETVAKRIKFLVEKEGVSSPSKMVYTWKCGTSDCSNDSPEAVRRWIEGVEPLFDKINEN